ncbi:MAG: AraC family transcriptional regulator, partial [Sphingobacteriales bacterium]
FIIEHRFDEKWSHYSLEGLSAEAGFNSRSTFFKAFKLATGTTPSDYFSNKAQ